jgi:hypothetical protein
MRNDFSTLPNLCSEIILIKADGMEPVVGNLEELGETGLVILTDIAFEPGTEVTIQAKNHQFKGSIANSELDQCLGYYLEVRLARDSYWSDRLFQPQHFTKVIALEESSVTEKVVHEFFAQRSVACAPNDGRPSAVIRNSECATGSRPRVRRSRSADRPIRRSFAQRCTGGQHRRLNSDHLI